MSNKNPTFLKDYKKPNFYITETFLDFSIYNDYIEVKSKLLMHRNQEDIENNEALVLNGEALATKNVFINGKELSALEYEIQEENKLIIKNVPDEFTFESIVHIDPYTNTTLMGIYKSESCICSQCEPEGFRRITWFMDRPDVMSIWTVSITDYTLSYETLLSNGNLIKEEKVGKAIKKTFHDICPKPSYLFAFVAGNFDRCNDIFITKSQREVQLNVFVEKGKKDQGWFALESLKKSMRWDEETYNLEYELDIFSIVAVSDFNFGAMENKSLNIFNDAYVLASPNTATDDDYFNIESIVAHEYFHNFTGDRITCRDWFQLTLKEGLTVYRDHKFSESLHNKDIVRINEIERLRAYQFAEDASPLSHPIRPLSYIEMNNFYTSTVYEKGAEVIRMIETIIGEENFKKGIDTYFANFDGMAVTCEDFIWSMEQASGISLEEFKKWYKQSGTPNVYVEQEIKDNKLVLTLQQKTNPTIDQVKKEALVLPLKMVAINKDNGILQDIVINNTNYGKEHTLIFNQEKATFVLEHITPNTTLSLNRFFSAPIILHQKQTHEDILAIIKYETDGFNRFEALQSYLKDQMLENIAVVEKTGNISGEITENVLNILDSIIKDYHKNPHLVSAMLRLPNFNNFELIYKTDFPVDSILNTVQSLELAISKRFYSTFENIYKDLHDKEEEFSASMMALRSLKNRMVYYLAKSNKQETLNMVVDYYNNTNSMTKKIGALLALKDFPQSEQHKNIFNNFFATYKNYPTVLNKWFAIKASINHSNNINLVKDLIKLEEFSFSNPNKVRAVLGSFAANYTAFHNKDGSGYKFLEEMILKLDKINPSISAGLAKAFAKIKLHTQHRQHLMLQNINNILDNPNISKGLYEIVSKIKA